MMTQDVPHEKIIHALLYAGRTDEALGYASRWMLLYPNVADYLYLYAIVMLTRGDLQTGIRYLHDALRLTPDNAVIGYQLGAAYLRAGDTQKSMRILRKTLKKHPHDRDARYTLGCAYLQDRQPQAALTEFTKLAQQHPDVADFSCAQADAARELGDLQQALLLYQAALQKDENCTRAHTNIGPLLLRLGNTAEALTHCRKAIALAPDQAHAYKNLGDCLVKQERLHEALAAYDDAYQRMPKSPEIHAAIATAWLEAGNYDEAVQWFRKTLQFDAGNITATCGLARIARESGDISQALALLQQPMLRHPENPELRETFAEILWEDGNIEAAIRHLRFAARSLPNAADIYSRIAHIQSSAGRVDLALLEYRNALSRNPACVPALNGIAGILKNGLDKDIVQAMLKLLNEPDLNNNAHCSIHNGLSYYYDSIRQYDSAAHHMAMANQHRQASKLAKGGIYERHKHELYIDRMIKLFDRDHFHNREGCGSDDESPVFIVGVPRSGTTLVEQILARHSSVLGIGERNLASQSFHEIFWPAITRDSTDTIYPQDMLSAEKILATAENYLAKLNEFKQRAEYPQVLRIVDKMPDNYSLLGWIVSLFPNARIIHCRRDPRDIALSCWMTNFSSIHWANDKENIIHRILQHRKIMEHWRQVLPVPILEIDYEELVGHQERESRKLIEWLELPWEDACMEFYNTDRVVRTASITQVRKPIYSDSIGRWRSYQDWLRDLFEPVQAAL